MEISEVPIVKKMIKEAFYNWNLYGIIFQRTFHGRQRENNNMSAKHKDLDLTDMSLENAYYDTLTPEEKVYTDILRTIVNAIIEEQDKEK